jgi:PEGA domain
MTTGTHSQRQQHPRRQSRTDPCGMPTALRGHVLGVNMGQIVWQFVGCVTGPKVAVCSHALPYPREARGHATQHATQRATMRLGALAALIVPLAMGGCLSRHLAITSEPAGARVWLNDVEIGRTPVAAEFTHFGDYTVRLEHEGYEPIDTHKRTRMPWYEYPPIDLAATILPFQIETKLAWHFELSPRTAEGDVGVEDRARALRERAVDGGGE